MTSTTNPELNAIVDTSIEAVKAGMRILRQYQGIRHMPAARVKADNSLVSDLDTRTEAAITKVMNQGHPGLPLLREESGVYGDAGSSRYVVLVDPLDGTRPMTVGAPTSTVILAVYDRQQRMLVATIIGSPAHGCVWVAHKGVTTAYWNDYGRDLRHTCQVWEGDLRPSTTVLIDNLSGFSRAGRYGLTNADLTKLVGNLNGQVALQAYGSNGLHQALLAEGNPQARGRHFRSPWWPLGRRRRPAGDQRRRLRPSFRRPAGW